MLLPSNDSGTGRSRMSEDGRREIEEGDQRGYRAGGTDAIPLEYQRDSYDRFIGLVVLEIPVVLPEGFPVVGGDDQDRPATQARGVQVPNYPPHLVVDAAYLRVVPGHVVVHVVGVLHRLLAVVS